MRVVPIHLQAGSDLRVSLEQLAAEQGSAGFVLGVVGNLSRAAFQCPGQGGPSVLEGDLEIITLQGTIAPGGVHLHLSLSDGDCQVWGGHLEPGTLVKSGADLLVGLLEGSIPSAAPAAADATTPASAIARTTASEPRLEIAVLPGCPFSARALRMLRTLGIPHRVESVESPEQRQEVAARSGRTSFPQIFIDGEAIGGYDDLADLHHQGALEPLRHA
jgi:glutaredoxin/predicted DNA-binding protein with PD1-like motif